MQDFYTNYKKNDFKYLILEFDQKYKNLAEFQTGKTQDQANKSSNTIVLAKIDEYSFLFNPYVVTKIL